MLCLILSMSCLTIVFLAPETTTNDTMLCFLFRHPSIFLKMSCCVPACAVPTCVPASSPPVCYPVGGLGSLTSCGGGAHGMGSYGMGPYGISSAGGSVSAASLGLVPGASVGCVNQTPASEVLIQPAPIAVVIPGAIMAATCEPVRVGGYSACATGASAGGSSKLRYYPCNPCGPCK